MRQFLLQPYPFGQNPWRKLKLCAGVGLFIALFLGVFRPFGFDNLPAATAWRHAFLFGAVTFAVSSVFQAVLPLLLPAPFREEGWRSWKEIVYLLVTTLFIGGGNYGLTLWLYPQAGGLRDFLWAELVTLEIGVFPVAFVVFWKQLRLFRRYAAEAAAVNRKMAEDTKAGMEENVDLPEAQTDDETGFESAAPLATVEANESEVAPVQNSITLRGDNQNEELAVAVSELLFLASADNYVNVHYRHGDRTKAALLRGSLKKFEEQLGGHETFLRCHRMYIVNLRAVTGVSGNAQGLKLQFADLSEAVPVSRSLTETVKERLQHLSRSPQSA